jgi:hypothetical protein
MTMKASTIFIKGFGNIPCMTFIPEERVVTTLHTLKGDIPVADYHPQTYVVDEKTFTEFADTISGKGLYFECIAYHMDLVALAAQIGCEKKDIEYVWTREEADGIPPHPTARMSKSYSDGWARDAPQFDHTRVKGSIIVQIKKASIKKLGKKITLNTAAQITEW